MKTIYLLRHAKSSWDDPDLADFDRPLNSRGLKAARFIGALMFERGIKPERIVSSPAKRAKQTAVLVREIAELPKLEIDDRIYEASSLTLFNLVSEFADDTRSVLIVGHNPGMEELIRLLTGEPHSIPTAALSRLTLNIDRWSDLALDSGTLDFIIRPKDLMPR